jgi:very-short-patch-repair endonuclease
LRRTSFDLDGPPHDGERQHDATRDRWLRERGYRILRVRNDIVIGGGDIVLGQIREAIRRNAAKV